MLSSDLYPSNTHTIKNQAPGIFQVLGAAALDIGLIIVFWLIALFFASGIWAISELITHSGKIPNPQPGALALLLMSMPTLYLAILALSAWRGRQLILKQTPVSNARLVLFAFGSGFTLFMLTVLASYLLNASGMALKPSNQVLLENLGNQWPVLITILAVVIAPVFEELFFRKQLFARFAAAGHTKTGYLLSSVLFALMHEPAPTQGFTKWLVMLAIYGSMGAVFAWVYQKTGRLWPAILAHTSNNIFAMSAWLISSSMR